MRPGEFRGIQPGDLGFDGGGGLVGALIRRSTTSPWAHCFVVVAPAAPGYWVCHEAYPGGLRARPRHESTVGVLVRVWRTPEEQAAILARSHALVGTGYAYGELLRIAGHYCWRQRKAVLVAALLGALVGSTGILWGSLALGVAGLLSLVPWDGARVICSNHAAQAALAARPELAEWLRYPTHQVWPGELAASLQRFVWNDLV